MLLGLVLFSLSLFCHQSTSVTDTISPSQTLKDGQILTSGQGHNFVLGFFSPGNSTSRRYVGIWYNKVATETIVWVANRDHPINGSDGILSITDDGNLILSSQNSTVWSTSISDKQIHRAQLMDSGNLVLVVVGTDVPAWQSFDYPTHVFLPGMKPGLDRRTGISRYVSSWRSSDDPGHGNYTFRLDDPEGGSPDFFVYKDGSVPVWRLGHWTGERRQVVNAGLSQSYMFNFTYFESLDEVYVTYNIVNDNSIISHYVLDGESGTWQGVTWHQSSQQWLTFSVMPQEDCDKYANCGAFGLCNPNNDQFKCSCFEGYKPKSPKDWYLRDATEGCVRAGNISMCRNREGFLKLPNVKVPDTSTAQTNLSMSLRDCREECLNNCSCLAFTSATNGVVGDSLGPTNGCILFHGGLLDTRAYDPRGQDLYVRVDSIELAKSLEKSKGHFEKKQLVILLVCVVVTLTFIISIAFWLYRKNRRECREKEERSLWLGEVGESDSNSTSLVLRFSTIVAATHNFETFLGEGGFGQVYKGKLPNGQEIAVKRLSKNSGQGMHEFKNEVMLISKLQHRNLVKTLGCCVWGEEKMLVYEFLPNNSLDKCIFDEEKKMLLDWSKRFEIINGIARGVLYLHQDSRLKIIHRDLKVSNILLDAKMNPKISDFGMARIFGNDQSEANTNRVVGTYGYMSPEYAMEGLFSMKSDVYSFGVILLEIITGQRSSKFYNDRSTILSGYVWKLWKEENARELIDKSIVSTICGSEDDILRCIQIGLLCVQESPNKRPNMLEVTFMLSSKASLPSPTEPAFIFKANHHSKGDPQSSSTECHSNNELTESVVDAR